MGILIHDVEPSGRPTEVALGSHNTLYWSQVGHFKISRIQDAWVRSRYSVEAMTGKAGSAFLLDTNALHRGLVSGEHERSVIFAEFHAHGKILALTLTLTLTLALTLTLTQTRQDTKDGRAGQWHAVPVPQEDVAGQAARLGLEARQAGLPVVPARPPPGHRASGGPSPPNRAVTRLAMR